MLVKIVKTSLLILRLCLVLIYNIARKARRFWWEVVGMERRKRELRVKAKYSNKMSCKKKYRLAH